VFLGAFAQISVNVNTLSTNTRITRTQCATKACCMGPLAAHTHTHLTALFPGLPGWAGTRKVKPIWILLKQETVSGSGISWAVCKSAPHSRQITMPASDYSVFLQASLYQCVVIVRWWIVASGCVVARAATWKYARSLLITLQQSLSSSESPLSFLWVLPGCFASAVLCHMHWHILHLRPDKN